MLATNDTPVLVPPLVPLLVVSDPELYECEPELERVKSLVFRAGGRVYACDLTAVREVAPLPRLTRVPGAPPDVIGLINLRGVIVTVIDAGALLHSRPIQRAGAMVLVVDHGPRGVGLAVECVTDVRAVRADEQYLMLDVRDAVARLISPMEKQ